MIGKVLKSLMTCSFSIGKCDNQNGHFLGIWVTIAQNFDFEPQLKSKMAPMDDILAEYCFALFWATLYVGISFLTKHQDPTIKRVNEALVQVSRFKWLQMS